MTAGANKTLIIFTAFYPYADFDSYIDEEINVLAEHFSKLYIISSDNNSDITRSIPPNAISYRYSPKISYLQKISAIKYIFYKDFYKELYYIKKIYKPKIRISILQYLLSSLLKADSYYRHLRKTIKKENIDVSGLYIYTYWMLEHTYAASKLKKSDNRITVFSRAHGSDLYFERNRIQYLPLKKITFNNLNAVFFISSQGREYFQSKHLISENQTHKLKVNRLGIINNYDKQADRFHDTEKLKIVSNAWIWPVKRIDLITKALALISEIEITWIHFGEEVYADEAKFKQFKLFTREYLNERDNIQIDFKGKRSNKDIYEYYKENYVDLFINVSSSEGIPVSMMEAMSFGIPVIATDVGGVSEIVKHKFNGLLLTSNPSPEEIASMIVRYDLMNENEKQLYRKNAYNTWQDHYNAERNYKLFIDQIIALK